MENLKALMLVTSVIGAAAAIFYTSTANPLSNYFVILALFVVIGIGGANIVLVALHEVYKLLKRKSPETKQRKVLK